MKEIFVDCIDYENEYEVSNLGNIRNKKTKKILSISTISCETPMVVLYKKDPTTKKNKISTRSVSRLIYESFNGKLEGRRYFLVNKDGDKFNNSLDNLELHDRKGGECLKDAPKGTKRKDSKLDDNKALIILMANYIETTTNNNYLLITNLAKEYGVDRTTVKQIYVGNRWKHIKIDEYDIKYCNSIINKYDDKEDILYALLKYKK